MRRKALSRGNEYRCSALGSTHMRAWQPCAQRWAIIAPPGACRPNLDTPAWLSEPETGFPPPTAGEKIPLNSRRLLSRSHGI